MAEPGVRPSQRVCPTCKTMIRPFVQYRERPTGEIYDDRIILDLYVGCGCTEKMIIQHIDEMQPPPEEWVINA